MLWLFSALGGVVSAFGDVKSIRGYHQCIEEHYDLCGGYHHCIRGGLQQQ